MEEECYLQIELTDIGPKLSRLEKATLLKPLTNLRQGVLDKGNISDIRSISKAIDAKIIVRDSEMGNLTQFVLDLPVVIIE